MAALRPRILLRNTGSTATASRPLATSAQRSLPRSPRHASTSTATPSIPARPTDPSASPFPPSSSSPFADAPSDPSLPEAPPAPPSFPAVVTSLTEPAPPTTPLSPDLDVLFHNLATSFVPGNQPSQHHIASHLVIPDGARAPTPPRGPDDPVIALVTPFEGGDAYITRAVNEVAAHLGADVMRLDLTLGVGFDGPQAPLAETGERLQSMSWKCSLTPPKDCRLLTLPKLSTLSSKLPRRRSRTSLRWKTNIWRRTTMMTIQLLCPR